MATEPPIASDGGKKPARLIGILTKPAEEWARIAAEPMTKARILLTWVVPLALIDPVARLISMKTSGILLFGLIEPPADYLAAAFVTRWVAGIATVCLLVPIIDGLAPLFGGKRDSTAALKLAAFSWIATFLSSIFLVEPMLAILALAGFYSYYVIHEGLTPVMQVPREKALPFTLVLLVAAILLQVAVGYAADSVSDAFAPVLPEGIQLAR
jgi:hypothetical protein